MSFEAAALHVVVAAILFSLNAAIARATGWDEIGTAWMRGFVAVPFLLAAATAFKQGAFRRKYWRRLTASGIISMVANVSWIIAAQDPGTTLANVTTLVFIYIFIIAMLDWTIRGKRPLNIDWVLMTYCMSGVTILLSKDLRWTASYGDYLTLLSAALYALQVFVIQGLQTYPELRENPVLRAKLSVTSILIGQSIGLVLVPLLLIGRPALEMPNSTQWLYLVLLGLSAGVGYLLMARSVQYLKGHVQGMFVTLEVPTAFFLSIVWLKEMPEARHWIGSVMVLSATIAMFYVHRNSNGKKGKD